MFTQQVSDPLSTYGEQALRLYAWNTEVSAAFLRKPLQGLEIVLRNALDWQLARRYGAA